MKPAGVEGGTRYTQKCSYVFMNRIRLYLGSSHQNHNYSAGLRVYKRWTRHHSIRHSGYLSVSNDLIFGRLLTSSLICHGNNCVR